LTISQVMFVIATIAGGIERSGLTSVSNTVVAFPSHTWTTATSVTRSPWYARVPVVSTSTTTNDSRCSSPDRASWRDVALDASRSRHRPSRSRSNRLWPANKAAAMCSATLSGAPGRRQTYEISDWASAGPLARKAAAMSVSGVSALPSVRPADIVSSRDRRGPPDTSCSAARRRPAPIPPPRT